MTTTISPLWRLALTDLDGSMIAILDRIVSDRKVTPFLNLPLELYGTAPSDNALINTRHTDGYPYLAEGVRQIYGFRRESDDIPYYTVRASTLVMQVDDAARGDDARTRFTAWDPWAYMFARPILFSVVMDLAGDRAEGDRLGPEGGNYPSDMTADQIVLDMIRTTVGNTDVSAPEAAQQCFIDYGQTSRWNGTIETCTTFADGYPVKQGTSLGQALQEMAATGVLDIVLTPIYDPANRPGLLCDLSIFSQTSPNTGAGDYNYGATFAWDRPGRSLVGIDDLFDGTQRADSVWFYQGQGGPAVPAQVDPASIATYGEYVAQQFFPSKTEEAAVVAIAAEQLYLRSSYRQTLTVNPAPERSPEPFVDYKPGDRVPVFASDRMRQEIVGWQRVFGIPVEIDDNGVETVRELLVGPFGTPATTGSPGSVDGGGGGGSGGSAGGGSTPTDVPTTDPPPTPTPGTFRLGIVSGATTAFAPWMASIDCPVTRYEWDIGDSAASMDSVFDDFYAEGIEVLPLAGFYGRIPTAGEAANIASWATRFGPGGAYWIGKPGPLPIQHIEFGNETSFSYQFTDNSIPTYAGRAQLYAQRFRTAALAVTAAVGGDVGVLCQLDDGGGWPWIANLAIGVPTLNQYWAGVTIHPYGTNGPSKAARCLSQAQGVGWGDQMLQHITEWGIASDDGACLTDNYGFPVCLTYDQAAELFEEHLNNYLDYYGSRLQSFYWYQAADQEPPGFDNEREHYFGLFQSGGTPKSPLPETYQANV